MNAHTDTHDEDHEDGHAGGTLGSYVSGFILSVVLTAVPFWLVMTGALDDRTLTAIIIMAFAVVQIVVHMVFFLHMNTTSEGGWNMMALIFTLVIVAIALIGSLWVMFHLNVNMMPPMQPMGPAT
ncbi:cytochrome o ubiquinol oxidase subunit IV [Acuticoccus sp. M5D2P5]|uniref:cytochrome o ubiquinol oxidase subunit IV n=1 Tax=Acuticoccus kalidii TaxID=2910977 RepID=UPI001F33BA38|nr:cytochrome o ubiquinol oxidase subunit IV [Acuticoccus kalidii]MCF3936607.1 cytochrome o ubiquinol oxidase subunit IV [Acuticoccus kalidii]